jgi:hypothetical protein
MKKEITTPKPIATFIRAVNDPDGFLSCFTNDAVVTDVGQESPRHRHGESVLPSMRRLRRDELADQRSGLPLPRSCEKLSHSPAVRESETAESQNSRKPSACFSDGRNFTVQAARITGRTKECHSGIRVKRDLT